MKDMFTGFMEAGVMFVAIAILFMLGVGFLLGRFL